MKKIFLTALALLTLSGCAAAEPSAEQPAESNVSESSGQDSVSKNTAESDRETLYQVSLLQGLTLGDFHGSIPVSTLREKGDIGIGTFDGVNGELVMLDGTVYRAAGDGSVEAAPDDETIPFANVTFFDADTAEKAEKIPSIDDLKDILSEKVNEYGKNRFYMVRIDGTFNEMNVRSELKQEEPYKTLAEALSTDQREFDYENISGTVVALYCPEYMNDLNATGWHLHFISDDRQKGGHVLDLSLAEAEIKWDFTDGFNMALPETEDFSELDLTKDQSDDIKKVETESNK